MYTRCPSIHRSIHVWSWYKSLKYTKVTHSDFKEWEQGMVHGNTTREPGNHFHHHPAALTFHHAPQVLLKHVSLRALHEQQMLWFSLERNIFPQPQFERQTVNYSSTRPLRLLLHPYWLPRAENEATPLFSPRVWVVDVEEGSLGGELCIY